MPQAGRRQKIRGNRFGVVKILSDNYSTANYGEERFQKKTKKNAGRKVAGIV